MGRSLVASSRSSSSRPPGGKKKLTEGAEGNMTFSDTTLGASTLLVPPGRYDVIARLHALGHIQHEEHRDDGILIKCRFPPAQAGFFAPFVVRD